MGTIGSLTNRVALVVGGGTGIGLGIARSLAGEGATVVVAGRRRAVLEQAVGGTESGGASTGSGSGPGGGNEALGNADDGKHIPALAGFRVLDILNRAAVTATIDRVRKEFGPIDILVNSAGINIPNRSMETMEPDDWDRILAINCTGSYNTMAAVLPEMRERGTGLIVNVCSIAGKRPLPFAGVAYSTSKFGLSALSRAVGNEESAHGIRVTTLYPGEVDTPLIDQRAERVPESKRAEMVKPEEIGEIVALIAGMPSRCHVPELTVKPLYQEYV